MRMVRSEQRRAAADMTGGRCDRRTERIDRDEMDEWRAANPLLALNEGVTLAIGMVLRLEPDEYRRRLAIDTLITAHRKAQAEFAAVAAGHERRLN
jgi:hypothetical protein